jgi:hypothetical protein
LVGCEAYPEKNIMVIINGVEAYIHGIKDGGADEMVFFGEPDPRAIEDRKNLKLSMKKPSTGLLETGVLIKG